MSSKPVSFPEAYLALKSGKAVRHTSWTDCSLILIPEKKSYPGQVDHPLVKKYLLELSDYDPHVTVPESFQLVYTPLDMKTRCSDGLWGPHVVDNYQVSAAEIRSIGWTIYDFV